jgi:hypothetical protein
VLVLVVNDHLLKIAAPGLVTGKLSDFAGLAFFPLLVVGVWEVAASRLGTWSGPRWRPLVCATLATGATFALVKTTTEGASVFGTAVGSVQWMAASLAAMVTSGPTPALRPVGVVRDPTDLIALAALAVAIGVGSSRITGWRLRLPTGIRA